VMEVVVMGIGSRDAEGAPR